MSPFTLSRNAALTGIAIMTLLSAARADNQTPDYTQPVTNFPLPYSLSLAVNNFGATPLPTLNAFASGQAQGDWVLLGGTSTAGVLATTAEHGCMDRRDCSPGLGRANTMHAAIRDKPLRTLAPPPRLLTIVV